MSRSVHEVSWCVRTIIIIINNLCCSYSIVSRSEKWFAVCKYVWLHVTLLCVCLSVWVLAGGSGVNWNSHSVVLLSSPVSSLHRCSHCNWWSSWQFSDSLNNSSFDIFQRDPWYYFEVLFLLCPQQIAQRLSWAVDVADILSF